MPTFYLIDHSLKGVGGHHFDYAFLVLRAAEAAGFRVVLGAHSRFREQYRLPAAWHVVTPFRHTTYCRFALYQSSRCRFPSPGDSLLPGDFRLPGKQPRVGSERSLWRSFRLGLPRNRWWENIERWVGQVARRRRIDSFARGCRRIFQEFPMQAGDQVFLPTLSEFDLQGLASYLLSDASSQRAAWHLQFHYNIFDGRQEEYAAQTELLNAMRERFLEALIPLPRHRLHFYTTAEPLAEQYNLLGVARFEPLTYPINSPSLEKVDLPLNRPLRVTCPGALRREKGQQQLASLVERLWQDQLSTGRLRLVVQSNKRRFRLPLPDEPKTPDSALPPVEYAPHPLPPAEYERLLKQADIGLLLYDGRRYFARRAGVLGELLGNGVPVIVPAGCWLSEQIAESIFEHREQLPSRYRVLGRRSLGELPVGPRMRTLTIPVPPGATDLLLAWQWPQAVARGRFARLQLRVPAGRSGAGGWEAGGWKAGHSRTTSSKAGDFGASGSKTGRGLDVDDGCCEIVGGRDGGPVTILLPCPERAAVVELQWSNAYGDGALENGALENGALEIGSGSVTFLDASSAPGGHAPSGAVGLIAADIDQVPRLLSELATHYGHYRRTAVDFSGPWRARHSATRTVSQLLGRATGVSRHVA